MGWTLNQKMKGNFLRVLTALPLVAVVPSRLLKLTDRRETPKRAVGNFFFSECSLTLPSVAFQWYDILPATFKRRESRNERSERRRRRVGSLV